MPPTTPVVGSRVVAERLDDRTGGGVAGAADDALLFRLVDNDVSRRVGDDGGDDDCEAFSLGGVDEIVFGAVAQPAFEEAAGRARLVGGDAPQAAAASGPATGLIGGGGEHRLHLAAQHQANVATADSNFELDTPTTERLFESLWPGVSELDDTVAPDSWSEDDFDLLFPDLA
jgi:hypothetical protein